MEPAAERRAAVTSFAVAAGSWSAPRAPMPTPRSNLAVGVQNNSAGQPILYAIGGSDLGTGPSGLSRPTTLPPIPGAPGLRFTSHCPTPTA
jgi:hypothetical protein